MAKVKGPLFSPTASGTIGGAINFTTWRHSAFSKAEERSNVAVVRGRVLPLVPKSAPVLGMRNVMRAGVSTWHDLSQVAATDKMSWDSVASGMGMSGFNRYCQKFVENNPDREPPWNIPEPE
jgi:hypothetical protein